MSNIPENLREFWNFMHFLLFLQCKAGNHQIEKQEICNEKEYIFDLSDHQHVEGCHVYPKHPGICKKNQSG